MSKRIFIGILVLVFAASLTAQNTKNYTPVNMYMLNPLLVNPAYSGVKESLSGAMMTGANWLDIPNAQVQNWDAAGVMYSFTADVPLTPKNSVGAMFVNNRFGVNRNTAIYGHYAYRIITGSGKLSFGLRGGFNLYNRDLSSPGLFRNPDPVQALDNRVFYPNFGAGVYWYTNQYYLGLSVPDFFFPPLGAEAFDANPQNYNYTFMGGYLFDLAENYKLKPSTMLAYSLKSPLAYQVNVNLIYKDLFWIGGGIKQNGVVILLDLQLDRWIRIGYAWELPTGAIRKYAPWGSHELLIRLDNSFEVREVNRVYFW